MSGEMTDAEFAQKVQWEGGLYDALVDYGLKSTDLADQDGELAHALRRVEALLPKFRKRLDRVEALLEDLQDDDDEEET